MQPPAGGRGRAAGAHAAGAAGDAAAPRGGAPAGRAGDLQPAAVLQPARLGLRVRPATGRRQRGLSVFMLTIKWFAPLNGAHH